MVFDKLFEKYFMNELAKKALSSKSKSGQDVFSITTYSIIYKLLQEKKIKLNFNVILLKFKKAAKKPSIPSIKDIKNTLHPDSKSISQPNVNYDFTPPTESKKSLSFSPLSIAGSISNGIFNLGWNMLTGIDGTTTMRMDGGYNIHNRKIVLNIWLQVGIEWEKFILDNPFKPIFKQILAALVHEGILIYNSKTNGSILDIRVNQWFQNYFAETLIKYTNLTTIPRIVSKSLSETWPQYMFLNIEKNVINGYEPLMKEKLIDMKKPSQIIYEPLMKTYFQGPLKKLIREDLPQQLNMDNESSEKLESYMKDLVQFICFMYFNRNKTFNLGDLKEVPPVEDELITGNSSLKWAGKCLGFKIVGDYEIFNDCYDNIYGVKNAYNNKKYFKNNYIFSELFMPTEIQAKNIYYAILSNVTDDKDLRLIDCAIKGLSIL